VKFWFGLIDTAVNISAACMIRYLDILSDLPRYYVLLHTHGNTKLVKNSKRWTPPFQRLENPTNKAVRIC